MIRVLIFVSFLTILSGCSPQPQDAPTAAKTTQADKAKAAKPDKTSSDRDLSKTALDAFRTKVGVTVIRGFANIGALRGELGGSVSVVSVELINVAEHKSSYGIQVITKTGKQFDRDTVAFVDYDEIDSLLKGIDFISKLDKSVTKLNDFEGTYRTRGGLEVTVFNSGSKLNAVVTNRDFGQSSVFLKVEDFQTLRELIVRAKERLDHVKN